MSSSSPSKIFLQRARGREREREGEREREREREGGRGREREREYKESRHIGHDVTGTSGFVDVTNSYDGTWTFG